MAPGAEVQVVNARKRSRRTRSRTRRDCPLLRLPLCLNGNAGKRGVAGVGGASVLLHRHKDMLVVEVQRGEGEHGAQWAQAILAELAPVKGDRLVGAIEEGRPLRGGDAGSREFFGELPGDVGLLRPSLLSQEMEQRGGSDMLLATDMLWR